MYCKKCGNDIKDGASFCPKCGEKVEVLSGKTPASMQPGMPWAGTGTLPAQKKPGLTGGQKKVTGIAVGAVVVVLLLIFLISRLGRGEEQVVYSLTGTWYSEDAVNLENAISSLLSEKAGLEGWIVDSVMEMTGLSYLGDITVTFDESGGLWLGGGGLAITIGSFSYQKIDDNTLMLKYAIDVPVVGEIAVSYQAKYTLDKDRLTLDLFGQKAKFRRQE